MAGLGKRTFFDREIIKLVQLVNKESHSATTMITITSKQTMRQRFLNLKLNHAAERGNWENSESLTRKPPRVQTSPIIQTNSRPAIEWTKVSSSSFHAWLIRLIFPPPIGDHENRGRNRTLVIRFQRGWPKQRHRDYYPRMKKRKKTKYRTNDWVPTFIVGGQFWCSKKCTQ